MNLYKLARDLYNFIEEVQTEAEASYHHLTALDPFSKEFKMDPSVLRNEDTHFLAHSNNRIDIFETEQGDIVWAAYSPQAAATDQSITNSHASLCNHLWKTHVLETRKRWCGFYQWICGNSDSILILYGVSSDYPHNQYSEEIVKRFVDKVFKLTISPHKVIIIGRECIQSYLKENS